MISPVASTLEEMDAILKKIKNGVQDISKLPIVLHKASGLSFRVGPMAKENYDAWRDLRTLEDLQHQSSGAAEKKASKNRDKSDAYILAHAVFSESGQNLTESIIEMLFEGKGYGPSTYILCEAAAKENPPRTELISEMQMLGNLNTSFLVMMRMVEKMGFYELLLDRFEGDEEEKARATKRLAQLENTLTFWESQYPVKEVAEAMETDIYARGV